jgi:hypothetical protein
MMQELAVQYEFEDNISGLYSSIRNNIPLDM